MSIEIQVRVNTFPQAPSLLASAISAALNDAGTLILADMQRRTPVDTGALRGSETASVSGQTLTLRAGGGSADHAGCVHDGTRHMAARPFMRDAIAAAGPALQNELARALEAL